MSARYTPYPKTKPGAKFLQVPKVAHHILESKATLPPKAPRPSDVALLPPLTKPAGKFLQVPNSALEPKARLPPIASHLSITAPLTKLKL